MRSGSKVVGVVVFLFAGIFLLKEASADNFVPANRTGDEAYATEYKTRSKPGPFKSASEPNREPTFWDKEYERSGFKQVKGRVGGFFGKTVQNMKNPKGFLTFFKNQEEKYLARKKEQAQS